MSRPLNLTGQRFARLLVTSHAGFDVRHQSRFHCVCDCGSEHIAGGQELKSGKVKSCGCLRVEEGAKAGTKARVHGHGSHRSATYHTWTRMKGRCLNPLDRNYRWYGAKGVSVCDRWLVFENFLADMGVRPEGKTLDRINPYGDYELSNCRWADAATQHANTRRNYVEASCQQ